MVVAIATQCRHTETVTRGQDFLPTACQEHTRMHGLGLIRPLTKTERQNLERLYKGCEAPGCPKQPECAITLEGPGDVPITVYACIEHVRSWATDAEDAEPDTNDNQARED